MPFRSLSLTGEQIRAGRALARIEQAELARRCGLSLETIKRLERIRGPVEANIRTLNAIVGAFGEIGILFEACEEGGVGVCRPPDGGRTGLGLRERAAATLGSGGGLGAGAGAGPGAGAGQATRLLHRLIYHSRVNVAPGSILRETIDAITDSAGKRNAALGVTGALLAHDGRFLQVLEGDKDAVRQVYGAILLDPRHTDVQLLDSRAIVTRQFSDWSLCCGVFPDDGAAFAHEPALRDGFRPELLSPASALGLLATMRDLQRLEPRSRRGRPAACALAADCLDRSCANGSGRPDSLSDCA
jgi:DNA-binding XRE family transcriptional regulator